MFQYATGRSIEITSNTKVKFDLSWFKQFPQRKYGLDKFNTKVDIANLLEIARLRRWERKDGRRFSPLALLRKRGAIHIKDSEYASQEKILNARDGVYLDGHWQSEKYFDKVKDIIRKEFMLKNEPSGRYKNIETEIRKNKSVSMHIRRGDYTMEKVQKTLALCSLGYYQKAIQKMAEKIENPTFFIFSDDIEWVKENLKIEYPMVFVSNDELKDHEELILMSKCGHNIIANSSFGWWGAWLNNNPNKIIITPKKWFKDTSKNTKDLISESWLKL